MTARRRARAATEPPAGERAATATREELAAEGLVPGGQPVAGWRPRRGTSLRVAVFLRAAAIRSRPSCLSDLAARRAQHPRYFPGAAA